MTAPRHDTGIEIVRSRWSDKPAYGRASEVRRAELGRRSALDIETMTDGKLYQKLVYRTESAETHPLRVPVDKFSALLKALEWTPREFQVATGLALPPTLRQHIDRVDDRERSGESIRPLRGAVRLPHYGSVSAGVAGLTQGNDMGGSTTDYVEISADYLDDTDPDDCHLVEVTGDSMTCENVRRAIPEGATVIVNTAIQPVTGDVIVAELGMNGDRVAILKVYRERERGVVLDSYNMEHNRIFLTPNMEPRIVGVVVNFIPPGRRALRRMVRSRTVS